MGSFDLPGGRFARTSKMGALASKISGRLAMAKVRAVGAADEKRQALMDKVHEKSAEEVVRAMSAMKGAVMKIGQMASFVTDDVPPAYQRILQKLQTQSDPMPFDLVREVVEAELGAPLEELFGSFEEEPLAAASIGQVHGATLPDGSAVVVKVQYPGVDTAIRSDLSNLSWTKPLFRLMSPGLDPEPMIKELRERLVEGLDYAREARNQNAFADLYAGHPFVHVPRAITSHCAGRVLTSERAFGHPYAWVLEQDEETRVRTAEILFRFVFSSIFEHHALNGDPHPGNYLFHEDGTVTFLDFGCVRYYEPQFIDRWSELLISHMEERFDDFLRGVREIGFFHEEITAPKDVAIEFFGMFYEPWRRDAEFVFTSEYTSGTLSQSFSRDSQFREIMKEVDMPAQFVFVNRIQWGLYAILTKLGGRGNFQRIFLESLKDAPPANALGAHFAQHRAAWKELHGVPPDAHVWLDAGGLFWSHTRDGSRQEIVLRAA